MYQLEEPRQGRVIGRTGEEEGARGVQKLIHGNLSGFRASRAKSANGVMDLIDPLSHPTLCAITIK